MSWARCASTASRFPSSLALSNFPRNRSKTQTSTQQCRLLKVRCPSENSRAFSFPRSLRRRRNVVAKDWCAWSPSASGQRTPPNRSSLTSFPPMAISALSIWTGLCWAFREAGIFLPSSTDPEPAERVHLDGPGPVVRLEERAVRKQVPASYQLLHVVHLDPFREGSGGEFLEKAGPPEEQGEKTVPSPDLHPLPQFPQGSRILPFQQEEIGLRQQAREPGMRVVFVTRNPSRLLEVLFRPFRVLKLLAHEGFEDMGLMQGIVAPHAFAQPQTLGRMKRGQFLFPAGQSPPA